jgi:riboflavin kinase/FMN adenylyltransferase
VRVHGLGEAAREGVASLGVRPTVAHGGEPLLEVYLFDFDAEIYGRRIAVEFLHKIRDEARYPDLHSLSRQIQRDVARAREYFVASAHAATTAGAAVPAGH